MQTGWPALAVLLAGCDVLLGLNEVSHDARTAVDAYVPDAFVAPSCKAIHAAMPSAPSGMYQIDPDGAGSAAALTVTCDMTTNGGGWTIIFVAESTNVMTPPAAYTISAPTLITAATSALLAFRDASLKALTGTASFDMPPDWKTATPFGYPAQDLLTLVSIDGAASVAGTLRYGTQNFTSLCSDGWNAASSLGRVCILGTTAPYYSGFATTVADNCSDSKQASNAVPCAADRQFSIAVR